MHDSRKELKARAIYAAIAFASLILIRTPVARAQGVAGALEGPSTQDPAGTVKATLASFYHWYLETLAKGRDPLHDDRAKIEACVSKALLRKIEKQINSPDGLDEDYFTKAQDYLNDWATNIVVSDVNTHGGVASAIVTLGVTKESKSRLLVNVVQERGSWKISKVSHPPLSG